MLWLGCSSQQAHKVTGRDISALGSSVGSIPGVPATALLHHGCTQGFMHGLLRGEISPHHKGWEGAGVLEPVVPLSHLSWCCLAGDKAVNAIPACFRGAGVGAHQQDLTSSLLLGSTSGCTWLCFWAQGLASGMEAQR